MRTGWLLVIALALSGCGVEVIQPATGATGVEAQALFDRRVNKLVTDTFVAYDHNRNGVLELERPSGGNLFQRIGRFLMWRDERVRSVTTSTRQEDHLTYTTRVYTRFPLFLAADQDHDRRLQMAELRTFIASYDKDGDGVLAARGWRFWGAHNEYEAFNADFGERQMSYRDIDLPHPSPGPTL